jgi:tetratricopeptide (TPR) repeat protein
VLEEAAGNRDAAEQSYRKATTLEPENLLAWGNLYTIQIGKARFDSAAATRRLMQSRFPAGPSMDARVSLLELGAREYDSSETRLRALVVKYKGDPVWSDFFQNVLAGILVLRGKLAEAGRTFAALAETRAAHGDSSAALEAELLRVTAVATLQDQRAARTQFDRMRGNIPGRVWQPLKAQARGEFLAARKETAGEAIEVLRKISGGCIYCVEMDRGLAFDRAGQADSALVHFQRWADAGENIWEAAVYIESTPLAYFRMGELYQQKGEREKAKDFYGRFTELWREADAELQPKVKEAKRRLAELTAETPRP